MLFTNITNVTGAAATVSSSLISSNYPTQAEIEFGKLSWPVRKNIRSTARFLFSIHARVCACSSTLSGEKFINRQSVAQK